MVLIRRQERFPDPKQVSHGLRRNRHIRSYSSVDEEASVLQSHEWERAYPVEMLARNVNRIIDSIALKRLFAAVSPPVHEVAVGALRVSRAKQHVLMVASKANEGAILFSAAANEEIHDFSALGPPVDVVSDKDKLSAPATANPIASSQKRLQFFKAAVDVADRKCHGVVFGGKQAISSLVAGQIRRPFALPLNLNRSVPKPFLVNDSVSVSCNVLPSPPLRSRWCAVKS